MSGGRRTSGGFVRAGLNDLIGGGERGGGLGELVRLACLEGRNWSKLEGNGRI